MDQARIEEIYEEISALQIKLSPDPRMMGPGYISTTVSKIGDATEDANALFTEVSRALARSKEKVRLFQLEIKERRRACLMSDEVQALEVASTEKTAQAELMADKQYIEDKRRELGANALAHIPTMERELADMLTEQEELNTLLNVIKEKKSHIKQADSDLRLQQAAQETELRLFGGAPTLTAQRPHHSPANPTYRTQADAAWQALSGDQPITDRQGAND